MHAKIAVLVRAAGQLWGKMLVGCGQNDQLESRCNMRVGQVKDAEGRSRLVGPKEGLNAPCTVMGAT